MTAQDLVKLAYQSACGSGHMLPSREEALRRLEEEIAATPQTGGELFTPIGGGLCRLNLAAFAQSGLPAENLVEYGQARFCYDERYRAMRRVLAENPEVTAAYAIADVVAIGAMRAAQDAGKTVGRDISIIGFDGLTLGNFLMPRLTTVRQSVDRLAQEAADTLRAAIEQGAPARHVTVPFAVIGGESVGPAPED